MKFADNWPPRTDDKADQLIAFKGHHIHQSFELVLISTIPLKGAPYIFK